MCGDLLALLVGTLLPAAADVQRRDGKLGSATDPGFLEDHHASAGDDNIRDLVHALNRGYGS